MSRRRPISPALEAAIGAIEAIETKVPDDATRDGRLIALKAHYRLAKENLDRARLMQFQAEQTKLAALRVCEEFKVSIELLEQSLGIPYQERFEQDEEDEHEQGIPA
jgi:hypothetical protein